MIDMRVLASREKWRIKSANITLHVYVAEHRTRESFGACLPRLADGCRRGGPCFHLELMFDDPSITKV